MTLIISLGTFWFFSGKPIQLDLSLDKLLPHWGDKDAWMSLTAIMMSFCGIEIATVHAADVENPQRAFPIALTYSVIIVLVTLILGSLAIASVLPHNNISLVAGIMQAFDAFFHAYHMTWIMPLIALMLVLGGLGSVNNWIIAPTKGLLVAANEGCMPEKLRYTNQHGAPTTLLVYQAIIVSVLCAAFLLLPTINSAYWFLTALAAQLYMIMYLMMFITAIKLRLKNPNKSAAFKVPGGTKGLIFISSIGILSTLVTIIISIFPPSDVDVHSMSRYIFSLLLGCIILCIPPLLLKDHQPEISD
jgi:amino acid transporter